jgi:hypothetical protein
MTTSLAFLSSSNAPTHTATDDASEVVPVMTAPYTSACSLFVGAEDGKIELFDIRRPDR